MPTISDRQLHSGYLILMIRLNLMSAGRPQTPTSWFVTTPALLRSHVVLCHSKSQSQDCRLLLILDVVGPNVYNGMTFPFHPRVSYVIR